MTPRSLVLRAASLFAVVLAFWAGLLGDGLSPGGAALVEGELLVLYALGLLLLVLILGTCALLLAVGVALVEIHASRSSR